MMRFNKVIGENRIKRHGEDAPENMDAHGSISTHSIQVTRDGIKIILIKSGFLQLMENRHEA